ncbi:heat-inducible transcriptional repressor HrcA [Schaalia vaccimaxillae]|uniref:heat-inducible transcriptional repressor HrcA n=1 Tax=Schaalia vaccimaxillae TaxID=183916 RepID=UPI00040AD881|nr:heat-inducible transcriptional repressor HrcA [Schaalia vaccimaxillae]
MSEERRLDVLRAIVTEYVHTREPVGSKVIAQTHDLGVSSATIRNDMAVLEEAGLIYQPHTSAGRVPTDKGYRVFVDRLAAFKPMSAPERQAVEKFLSQSTDIDEVVAGTVRLLAQVTRQVAVVEYPTLENQTLRRAELVDLGLGRLLVIVITDAGRVQERTLEPGCELDEVTISDMRARFNEAAESKNSRAMVEPLEAVVEATPANVRPAAEMIRSAIIDLMTPAAESRIMMAGISNLARGAVDFRDIAPVLDALEEQVVLMRLFAELDTDQDLHVSIGTENTHDGLSEASIITGTYRVSDAQEGPAAHLGIIGPTRMDYSRTMSSVRAISSYLSRYLTR